MTADLRYPIGRLEVVVPATDDVRRAALEDIAALPVRMRAAVDGLSDAQLDTPYRPGGWTIRQVVHHVPALAAPPGAYHLPPAARRLVG